MDGACFLPKKQLHLSVAFLFSDVSEDAVRSFPSRGLITPSQYPIA
jgi:hypothetical protein